MTWIYKTRAEVADPDAQGKNVDLPYFILANGGGLKVEEEVLRCVGEKRNQHADRRDGQLSDRKVIPEHVDFEKVVASQTRKKQGGRVCFICCLLSSVMAESSRTQFNPSRFVSSNLLDHLE